MEPGPRGLQFVVRPPGPLELALLFVVALALLAEAVRVMAGTALAERPPTAAAAAPEPRCGLVKRAHRTWVGFGPGLGPSDLIVSARAAAAAVRALDSAFCAAFVRGESVSSFSGEHAGLKDALGRGGFEVSRVLLSGASMTHARLRLHASDALEPRPEWSATLSRAGEHWHVSTLSRFAPR
jgi:hypothetical protein